MSLLKIDNLKKSYQDLVAVNGVSLDISAGEAYGVLGPNGAGKSTLINCMLGLTPYDSGMVVFENKHTVKNWNRYIGYVPQELAIYPELTPAENIRFFASLYGIKGISLNQQVDLALEFVGLEEVRNKKAGEFSGGMKRRLNLACAIAHSPKLIIMDEPTVGIDPQSRNRILENVHTLNQQGATIIYTTHYMQEVEELCNKIAVLDTGQVIANGTKHEIMAMMGNDEILSITFNEGAGDIEAFLSAAGELAGVNRVEYADWVCKLYYDKSASVIERITALSTMHQLSIQHILNEEPKLEEIFLTLTGKTLRDE